MRDCSDPLTGTGLTRRHKPLDSIAQVEHSISPDSSDSILCSAQTFRRQFEQCSAAGRSQKENSHTIIEVNVGKESGRVQ